MRRQELLREREPGLPPVRGPEQVPGPEPQPVPEPPREQVPGLELIGAGTAPHILPVTLPGYKSEVVVRFLSDLGIYVSSGSACHKGKPSHVFAALNLPKKARDGVLRVSFSYDTTREDVDALAQGLEQAGRQLFTALS